MRQVLLKTKIVRNIEKLSGFFAAAICLVILSGCIEGDNATDELFGSGTDEVDVPVPTTRTVRITVPDADGESVGYLAHVEGTCNPAGGVISFYGSGTGTTLCQIGGSFTANIDVSSAAIGTVVINARLEDSAGYQSAVSTRRFSKTSTACDSATARSDTYANFSTTGDGGATPWQICNKDQFDNIRLNISDNFQLENDIDFNGDAFTPIAGQFAGELNGQGFAIRNLSISQSGDSYGIFREARGPAYIYDLNIENISIDARDRVGVLIGYIREQNPDIIRIENINIDNATVNARNHSGIAIGRIGRDNNAGRETFSVVDDIQVSNSSISGGGNVGGVIGYVRQTLGTFTGSNLSGQDITVTGSGSQIGGIIGYIEETGGNTSSDYTLTGSNTITGGTDYVGAVVGRIQGGTNSNFSATATVVGNGTTRNYAGGLFGLLNAGTFSGTCNFTGTINASDYRYVGGIVGYLNDGLTIDGCVVDANVNGRQQVGGIIGRMDNNGSLLNSSASPTSPRTITASEDYAGGAVGYGRDGITIDSVTANSNVTSSAAYVGGVVGYLRNGATLNNSFAYGDVQGTARVGGFVGSAQNPDVDDCHAEGNVQGTDLVGGFIGRGDNSGTYDLSSATGDVTSTAGGNCGGFAGYVRQSNIFRDSYAEGDVDCFAGNAGGFLGGIYRYGQLLRVYATGDVAAGGDYVGGLAGLSNQNHNTVRDSFAVGDVSSTGRYVGGLVGYIRTNNGENFKNNFALGNVSGNESVGGLAGYFYRPSNNSMKQMYTLGQVTKPSWATGLDARFGAVLGETNDATPPYGPEDSTLLFVSGQSVYDQFLSSSLVGQNSYGTAMLDSDLRNSSQYPAGYDFITPEWEMNFGSYVLPGTTGSYLYPLLDWQQ